jgi:hypothetical protein
VKSCTRVEVALFSPPRSHAQRGDVAASPAPRPSLPAAGAGYPRPQRPSDLRAFLSLGGPPPHSSATDSHSLVTRLAPSEPRNPASSPALTHSIALTPAQSASAQCGGGTSACYCRAGNRNCVFEKQDGGIGRWYNAEISAVRLGLLSSPASRSDLCLWPVWETGN